MKTLFTLDIQNYEKNWTYSKRDSARGIIIFSEKKNPPFAENDKIALVYAKNKDYYKFPGGGLHEDENKVEALIREVSEEVGLSVIPDSVREYGVVPRFQKSAVFPDVIFDQESFYYFCDVDNKGHGQNLDPYEAEAGFELQVTTIKQAIETNMKFTSDNKFDLAMIVRDTNILQLLLGGPIEPSRGIAEFLLDEAVVRNPGPWKNHSLEVGKAAEKIARAVVANGGNMNPDRAYVYGLLHDIGRRNGVTYMAHVIDGYEYLSSFGFEKAARIALTHSFNLQIIDDYIGKVDIPDDKYQKIKQLLAAEPYDDYDRLIQVLDATCTAEGPQPLEDRMGDVKKRYGYYPQPKWDKNFELKQYFEKLMNKDLFEVLK